MVLLYPTVRFMSPTKDDNILTILLLCDNIKACKFLLIFTSAQVMSFGIATVK